jgi:hypothetical protein
MASRLDGPEDRAKDRNKNYQGPKPGGGRPISDVFKKAQKKLPSERRNYNV